MICPTCARKGLNVALRPGNNTRPAFVSQQKIARFAHLPRPFTSDRRTHRVESPVQRPRRASAEHGLEDDAPPIRDERPSWQLQKAALKQKLGGEAWNPRKKLSPDTLEGIRHLHSSQPHRFTTPILAEYFKVTPEAIRRILKSNWRPSDEEYDARMQRWNRRGERIWTNLVELGVKPPKMWRDMGVGKANPGERPKWKSRGRNMVHVQDSANDAFVVEDGDIIPVVDESGKTKQARNIPLSHRL